MYAIRSYYGTHHAREKALSRAVQAIDRLQAVRAKTTVLRIEESLA